MIISHNQLISIEGMISFKYFEDGNFHSVFNCEKGFLCPTFNMVEPSVPSKVFHHQGRCDPVNYDLN